MRDRRGVALVLVLWIIVALSAIASAVVLAARGSTRVAANYRARAVARYAAESGVTVAVATLEEGLLAAGEAPSRREFLNRLDDALGERARVSLGDARVALELVDVGARLDANAADAVALGRLFSFFTDPVEAERTAGAIRGFVGGAAEGLDPASMAEVGTRGRPLRSVEELFRVPGVRPDLLRRVAPYLTVDGDGTINRATASDTVLAAAAGELRDEPTRILVVSRGWQDGHPLTHQIEAVYAVLGGELSLIRWRERDL